MPSPTSHIRYRAPARLDDALVVAQPGDAGARRERRHSSDESCAATQLLAEAEVTAALVAPRRAAEAPAGAPGSTSFERLIWQEEQDVNPILQHGRRDAVADRAVPPGRLVVKVVMVGLLLASIWTWAIIIGFWLRLGRVAQGHDAVRARFLEGRGYRRLLQGATATATCRRRACSPPASPNGAARPRAATIDRDGTRERLATAMGAAVGGGDRQAVRPAQHPRDGRLGRAVRRAVRHGLGHHAQLHRHRRRAEHRRWRWSRRASPRRCSRPRSACSRRSRR